MAGLRQILFFFLLAQIILFGQNSGNCEDKLIRYSDFKESPDENYLLKLDYKKGGALLYFGAQHSADPKDEQFSEIKKAYLDFKPGIVFYEGSSCSVGKNEEETIRRFSEPGFIRFLALKDSIPAESLEPDRINEVKYILKKFTPEQAVLFYTLREASNLKERYNAPIEEIKEYVNQLLSRMPGLEANTIKNTGDLEKAYKKYWTVPAMWYDAPSVWFDPLKTSRETGGIFTNELNSESSHYRNVYMYKLLTKAVKEGRRVFVVVGRNHVPMQREAIKCALEDETKP
jgi:hypothetical protein